MTHTCSLYEAISIFEENLPDIRKACLENVKFLIGENTPYKELDAEEPVTIEAIRLHSNHLRIQDKVTPLFQTIRRIDSHRVYQQNPQSSAGITDMDIQHAREATPDWFIYQADLGTKRPHKGVCPFHNDTSPSLTLMQSKKSENFYLKCFVCNKAWDSIGYIMERENIEFMDAVRVVIS